MLLNRTQNAIAELAASRQTEIGDHRANYTVYSSHGLAAASEPFDFTQHDVDDREAFSLDEEMTDHPHVSVVFPERPLDINVVMHSDPEEVSDVEEIIYGRKALIDGVYRSIKESLLFEDSTKQYMVGRLDEDLLDKDAEFIDGTEDPQASAKAVADICKSGLTLVVSTFRNLPLDKVNQRYKATIGLKANHPYDLELPRNIGTWDVNEVGMSTVDTNDNWRGQKSNQLERYQQIQKARHEATVAAMTGVGIHMASAVFEYRTGWFDIKSTDKAVAGAIGNVSRRG
jgi:hypothetical protein